MLDRPIYRAIRRGQFRKIVELGIGIGQRAVRMIEVAGSDGSPGEVRYTGIDLFEARSAIDGPGVTLKMAHRLLKATGARVQLLPGDPFTALSRAANGLTGTDLLIISARQDPRPLARAWFYIPRMLHAQSLVLIEEVPVAGGPLVVRRVGADEIARLASRVSHRRAA